MALPRTARSKWGDASPCCLKAFTCNKRHDLGQVLKHCNRRINYTSSLDKAAFSSGIKWSLSDDTNTDLTFLSLRIIRLMCRIIKSKGGRHISKVAFPFSFLYPRHCGAEKRFGLSGMNLQAFSFKRKIDL